MLDPVEFSNLEFEKEVRRIISKPTGTITRGDVKNINRIRLSGYGNPDLAELSDFSALEYFTGISSVDISGTKVSNLEPLSKLTKLSSILLWDNDIDDISPLKDMIWIEELRIGKNRVTDISNLANLENLSILDLRDNGIGVCEGYAFATELLLRGCGIEVEVVVGEALTSEFGWVGHAWNVVTIDGVRYNLDVTWDDPAPSV